MKINLKKPLSLIDWNLIFKWILWGLLCIAITFILILLFNEKNYYTSLHHNDPIVVGTVSYYSINDIRKAIGSGDISTTDDLAKAYRQMVTWTDYPNNFPLIGFSLLYFIPGTNKIPSSTLPLDAWNTRWNNITLAYSYFFITLLIAYVALILLAINGFKNLYATYVNKKLGIIPIPVSNFTYVSFTLKNITEFIVNLTLVFAFFNFLSTLVVICYWIFLYVLKFIIKYATRNKIKVTTNDFEINKSDLYYLIGVMIFQNTYILLKAYFINGFGVNLDIIMQIIMPIGTVTVIIALFIKNLMNSKITKIKQQILSIGDNIDKIRMFIIANGKKSFSDYQFITILPNVIKKYLLVEKIDSEALITELNNFEQIIKYIEKNFNKKDIDMKYLVYIATYICNTKQELDIFYNNLQKLTAYNTKR